MITNMAGSRGVESNISVRRADGDADVALGKALFFEYAESLDSSLCFQGFDVEMERFPGSYGPPRGCLLVGFVGGELAGVVGLRPISVSGDDGLCEMKRLYVRPGSRNLGIGQRLVRDVISEARSRSYRAMRLDTLPSMKSAREIYGAFGFKPIGNYNESPLDGIEHFGLDVS